MPVAGLHSVPLAAASEFMPGITLLASSVLANARTRITPEPSIIRNKPVETPVFDPKGPLSKGIHALIRRDHRIEWGLTTGNGSLSDPVPQTQRVCLMIKTLFGLSALALLFTFAGCTSDSAAPAHKDVPGTTRVSLEGDVCGSCGCIKGSAECCKGEKCEKCGMQKGSLLCCSGVKPADGVTYCQKCGYEKGSANCCAEGNVTCEKCGLASGSPLCCKIKPETDDKTAR
jgi:hypothetical protein